MAYDDHDLDQPIPDTEAVEYLFDQWRLRRGKRVLQQYRRVGGGPKFFRIGNDVRYNRRFLDEWARSLLGDPVSSNTEISARRLLAAAESEG